MNICANKQLNCDFVISGGTLRWLCFVANICGASVCCVCGVCCVVRERDILWFAI